MADNTSNTNSEIIIQMVRDLSNKVDSLPTRHEYESLNARFDALDAKMDRYALQSEFNQYREFANQRAKTYTEKTDERINEIVADLDAIKGNRLPQWFLVVVLCALTLFVNIGVAVYQHSAQQQLVPVQTTSTTTTTQQQSSKPLIPHNN